MARITWAACMAVTALWAAGAQAAQTAPERLDQAARKEGKAFIDSGNADGLSIAVVKDGKASFYDFGTVERGKARTPTADTVYEIGSISKTFGSLLLAQAVLEHKAQLGDDMRQYLPPGEYPGLAYQGRPVTLQQLVSTTSALPDNLPESLSLAAKQAKPGEAPFVIIAGLNRYTPPQFLADLHQATLQREPGKTPAHSNVAAQVVGLIDAKLLGKPFESLLAERIERPLGMASGADKARAARMAVGYTNEGRAAPVWDAPVTRAAGGLRYSPRDMARYVARQLDESDAAVKLSHQPQWGDPGEFAIAFNWVINTMIDGQRRLSHTGGTFGFASYMEVYPGTGYGVVLLTNRSANNTQGQLQEVAEHIRDQVFGVPAAQAALEKAFDEHGYGDVAGTIDTVRHTYPALHLSENYLNAWGYRLLQGKRAKDAVNVFAYNVAQHPQSFNPYDSLAECQEALGEREHAIANYRLSLERNPNNEHAKTRLAELAPPKH
ncbi:serine hydrolase [Dyella sp. 2RAB6]|uniref:serine hydrolase domain-containing protein n=1 Tax=Dyella sp. 2RAB6 TaxID=3232992 RepID=UPI003F8FFA2E